MDTEEQLQTKSFSFLAKLLVKEFGFEKIKESQQANLLFHSGSFLDLAIGTDNAIDVQLSHSPRHRVWVPSTVIEDRPVFGIPIHRDQHGKPVEPAFNAFVQTYTIVYKGGGGNHPVNRSNISSTVVFLDRNSLYDIDHNVVHQWKLPNETYFGKCSCERVQTKVQAQLDTIQGLLMAAAPQAVNNYKKRQRACSLIE